MAITTTQAYLARLSLRLSHDIGDEVSVYTAKGKTILASQRESAINRAVLGIYEEKLSAETDERNFLNKYMEYRGKLTFNIIDAIPNSRALVLPAYVRKDISARLNTQQPLIDKTIYGLTPEQYQRAQTKTHSNFKPSVTNPSYYISAADTGEGLQMSIEIGGTDLIRHGTVELLYLKQPVYQEFNTTGPDIIAPGTWEDLILQTAIKYI